MPSEESPVPPQHLRIPGPTPLPDAVREALAELGFASIETVDDLAGIERVVTARKPL